MAKLSLIEKACRFLNRIPPIIPYGYQISPEDIYALAKTVQKPPRIAELLQAKDGEYSVALSTTCADCEIPIVLSLGKSAFSNLIDEVRHGESINKLCEGCRKVKRAREKQERELARAEEAIHSAARSASLRERWRAEVGILLLTPEATWEGGLNNAFYNIRIRDEEWFAEKVKSMPYREFLQTPYWLAISYEVKRRSGFRCAVCNGKEMISTHHRSYKYHGYEHTREGMKDLIALCDNCHSTFHDK